MKFTVLLPAHIFPDTASAPLTATVERWEKSPGQAVMQGDTLAVLQVGKETFPVPSPKFGVLAKKCVLPGEGIEAGEPLAILGGVSVPLPETPPKNTVASSVYVPAGPEDIYTLSATEQAIATHNQYVWRNTPQSSIVTIADISEALRYIEKTERGETVTGIAETPTLFPFVLSAVAASLIRFPALNAEFRPPAHIHRKRYVHLGLETYTDSNALIVPVLREVNHKSVLTLAREWQHIQSKIRANTLTETDVSGATFTVSQTPTVLYRIPLLHRPLTGHLCFGKPFQGQIYLCLTYDATIVTSYQAEAFLAHIADYLSTASFLFAG